MGLLTLILLVESLLHHWETDFSSAAPWDWRLVQKRVERGASTAEVLCFGDSQMKLGVLPRVIEDRTGLRSINLALIGGQMPASTVLLRRALQAGARPNAILVNALPPLLAAGIDRNMRQWPELLSVAECVELAWTEGDSAWLGRLLLAKEIPSVKLRQDLRASLFAALQGVSSSRRSEYAIHLRNWSFNRGAMLLPRYGDERDMKGWYRANFSSDWSCHSTHMHYLRRFLELASIRGIRVFWLMAPLDPEGQELIKTGGQDARIERFLQQLMGHFPNLSVIDARHARFDRGAFTDPVHLHAVGSFALSDSVAHVLQRELASSTKESPARPEEWGNLADRWIKLPSYRPLPVDVPLEDINQSMLAVQQAEARRR